MKRRANNWLEWWDSENIVTHDTWLNNMEIFVKASDSLVNYSAEDIVLDLGSGPCYLATFLKNRVKEIHCLDTSERYLELCKDKLSDDDNIFIHKLDKNNYTNLSILEKKKFSIIICQSVIQYYKSISEVETLIQEVQKVASPGARFLISDIPTTNNLILLAYRLLKTAFLSGRVSEISQLLFKLSTSKHRKIYSSFRLLTLSEKQLKELIDKLGLDASILKEKMTCNDNRRHLLIRF